MTNQSRRQFLKTGALFGAASAAAAVSAPAFSTEAPQKWDETTGLLIVGTGFAGCAAALEAHYLGAKKEEIMLVDKMSTPGGNSIINGGAVAAAGTDMQGKEGIKDSADLLFADIMKAGGGLCHPALARRIADESVANFKWLRDDIGVQFKAVTYHGGHSVKRSHAVTNNSGSGFILPMLAKLKEFGIEPRLRFIVDEIIVNDKKEVIGVKARQGYRFGRENSGKVLYVRATKGVLIAAGGFAQNVKYRMSQDPRLTDKFTSTNHPGATGDGLVLAEKAGAQLIDMTEIQTHPTVVPKVGEMITEAVRGNGAILINKDGKRFFNELNTRDAVSAAILKQKDGVAYLFFDSDMQKSLKATNNYIKQSYCLKGETLDELAGKMGVPADKLKASLEAWKQGKAAGKDAFGRADMPRNLDQAPFYAIMVTPAVHHTMGGIKIDSKTQVYNTKGQVVPGLFAAGEITGGVHGGNRLGGNAQADIVTFGRIAGQSADAYLKTAK